MTALDLHGLIVPVVTPFDEQLAVDLDALERHAAAVLDAGARGIVALATTGEPTSLDEAERAAVVDAARGSAHRRRAAGGRRGHERHPHDGRAPPGARRRPGLRASLAVVPYYVRPSEAAIVAHFRHVAERSPVPLVVYNIPYRTGRGLGAESLLELAATPNVAGLKQAVGAIDVDTLALLAAAPPTFAVLGGDDAFLYPLVLMGGPGAIAASANVGDRALRRDARLRARGAARRGPRARRGAAAADRALFAEPSPAVIKAVLHAQGGIPTPHVRMPLADASPGRGARRCAIADGV